MLKRDKPELVDALDKLINEMLEVILMEDKKIEIMKLLIEN